MAFVIADRVRETTTTIGTGSITLAGAYTSFQSFSAAIGNGNNTYYTIASASSGEWEVGIGTYSSGGNLLSRDTVLSSSNAGNLVNFSVGSKDVFVTQPASRAIFVQNAGTGLQTGTTAFTANRVLYANATSTTTTSANLTFDGTTLTAANFADSSLTSGRVTYATTSGNLTDSANLTFDGSTLTANALTTTSTVTINGGTANGVAYLNGSKVLTTGSALTFDGTALAPDGTGRTLGTTALRWGTVYASAFADGTDQLVGSAGAQARFGYGASWTSQAFAIGGSEQMRLTSTGLGIGTSSPDSKLHVFTGSGSNTASLRIGYSGTSTNYYDANTHYFRNGAQTDTMTLTSTGLGIGTSSPGVKLDVVGLARITAAQNLILNGATGTYSTVQYNGTSIGDIGTGNQVYSGGGTTDLAIAARPGYRLVLGSNGAQNAILDTSGNLGLGVTPSAWESTAKAFQFSSLGYVARGSSGQTMLGYNNYLNTSNQYIYSATSQASRYEQISGEHRWFNAASGTAGNAITFTQAMTLDASGNLGLGATSPLGAFEIIRNSSSGSGVAYPNIRLDNQSATGYTGFYFLNSGTSKAFLEVKNDVGALTMGTGSTERARITSGGDFVINGTSANAKLDVISSATGSPTMRANFNGAVTYQNPHLLLQNQNQANGDKAVIAAAFRTSGGSGYTPVAFGGIQTDNSNRYGAFVVYVSSSDNVDLSTQERMRLDSSGNLGLGVTPPASGARALYIAGAVGGYTAIALGASGGDYGRIGYGFSVTGSSSVYNYLVNDTASAIGFSLGGFQFFTAPAGTAGNAISFTQAMTLDASGNLLVGITSAAFGSLITNNGSYHQYGNQMNYQSSSSTIEFVNRDSGGAKTFSWYYGASGGGFPATLSTSGVWTNASDARGKENIADIKYGLTTVLGLKPRQYDVKSDGSHAIGFVAQEVLPIIPELVHVTKREGDDEFYGLDYGSMTAVLVKAIQELKAEFDAYKATHP